MVVVGADQWGWTWVKSVHPVTRSTGRGMVRMEPRRVGSGARSGQDVLMGGTARYRNGSIEGSAPGGSHFPVPCNRGNTPSPNQYASSRLG